MNDGSQARSFSETRFRVPARSDRFVRRPRVTNLLDAHNSRPVTLVTGPAGTGKTLAVAEWTLEGHPTGPLAWLSLDRGDANVSRFWTSILAALFSAVPAALRGLEIPDSPNQTFLQSVADKVGGSLVIVLDDVQEIDDGSTIDWLDQVLRWPPDGVRFVLVSRHDPPMALQKLRLDGKVGDVRVADLSFTRSESQELMAESGVTIAGPALDRLMDTTGGWAAALRLAALTLQLAEDPSDALERFGGVTFLVSEYLWDEVLHLLPANYGDFLLRTSVSGRLCAPLAVVLTGEPRADEMLRTLAREQLLAHEVEGTGWYRTHSLLTEVLHARLKSAAPDLEQELQRKAALWFEQKGAWLEALDRATASGDWDFIGQITMRSGAVALFGPDRQTFIELIARIPGSATVDNPELAVAHALSAFCSNNGPSVLALTARAEGPAASLPEPRRSVTTLVIRALQAAQAHRDGDALAMRDAATDSHILLTGLKAVEAPGWAEHRGVTLALRGVAELWAGRPAVASDLLAAAVESCPKPSYSPMGEVYYRGLLALAHNALGRLSLSRGTAEAALEIARARGRSRSYESQWAWLALGVSLLYGGDGHGARAAFSQCAEAGSQRLNPFVAATLHVLTARQALAGGDLAGARRKMLVAEADLSARPGMVLPLILLTSLRVDLAVAEGDTERARVALAAYDAGMSPAGPSAPPVRPDSLSNSRARFLLAVGQPERVRPAVEHLLDVVGAEAVQAWLSVSAAEDRLRHDSLSIEAMARALDLAEAESTVLPFLSPTRPLASALRRHLEVVGTHRELVERALVSAADAHEPRGSRSIAPLTEREQAVLSYLPTMGSNAEIANALSISENTVKQHLKSIYRKLSVSSRREAVRVARSGGLLDRVGGLAAPQV